VIAAVTTVAALALAGCSGAAPSSYGQLTGTVGCTAGTVQGLTTEQAANAKAITAVALGLGLGQQGVLVGILTANVESDLTNVTHGDAPGGVPSTSLGLYQQLAKWGPQADRLDPTKAATMFYTGGKAGQKGLMQVPGWQSMAPEVAMQAVEQSEFTQQPGHQSPGLAGKLTLAQTVTQAVTATCTTQKPATTATGSGLGGAIVAAAETQLGIRYSWGGGDLKGPTVGQHDGGVADRYGDYAAIGWDCSALTRFAVYTATGGKVEIPRTAADQRAAGTAVAADLAAMQPGDLIVFGTDHVGIYVGSGRMINAPESGQVVRYDPLATNTTNWTVRRIMNTTT
jgi:cell wall-associated NlpC family hydrolase